MKTSKRITISTFVITVLSLILLVVSYKFCSKDIYYDVFLAIFGSGILAFVLSLIEYIENKRKVIFTFYEECGKLSILYSQIQPMVINFTNDILVKFLSLTENKDEEVTKKINDYFSDNNEYGYTIDDLREESEKYKRYCYNQAKIYSQISNYDITKLGNLYKEFSPLFCKKNVELLSKIFNFIADSHNIITRNKLIIDQINYDDNYKYEIVKRIKELDDYHVKTETKVIDDKKVTTLTKTFAFELDQLLEELDYIIFKESIKETIDIKDYKYTFSCNIRKK